MWLNERFISTLNAFRINSWRAWDVILSFFIFQWITKINNASCTLCIIRDAPFKTQKRLIDQFFNVIGTLDVNLTSFQSFLIGIYSTYSSLYSLKQLFSVLVVSTTLYFHKLSLSLSLLKTDTDCFN